MVVFEPICEFPKQFFKIFTLGIFYLFKKSRNSVQRPWVTLSLFSLGLISVSFSAVASGPGGTR